MRLLKDSCHGKNNNYFAFTVVGTYVALNNTEVFSVAVATQRWVPLTLLQNYKVFPTDISNIVRVIKSRRMRWAGHVARMGEERGVYRFLVWKPE